MTVKYTNDFTLVKNILKTEYMFILTLLFTNFNEIIYLLKEKNPLYGEILEYLYFSIPTYFNSKSELICKEYKYIDSILRIIYKNNNKKIPSILKNDIKNICTEFHIEKNDFEYYYVMALLIISIENTINIDAYNLYSQIDDSIKKYINILKEDFFKNISLQEFQCLFYNHLEDVYKNNTSENGEVSLIYNDNYSYFLSNLSVNTFFSEYLQKINNERYPIVISNNFIYNIVNQKINILQTNSIDLPIFCDNIKYIASYHINDNTIRNWIPFFNYFYNFNNLNNNICIPFYNDYIIEYTIEDIDNLNKSENFYIFDNEISNIHYYINQFTIYSYIDKLF